MILCADDFGLNSAVSTGILNLLRVGKINSVSCLTTTNCWKERASELKPFLKSTEAGLHLTLTYPKPIHFSGDSLGVLLQKSYLGQLKKQEIVREIRVQIELFKDSLGCMPNYVDGHEFCHHLPTVREALVDIAREFHFKVNNIYIRVFHPGRLSFRKNVIFWIFNHLAAFPSRKLQVLLKAENIPFNSRLLGFHPYHLEPKKYFDYYFQTKPSKKDIFFCHPGLPSEDSFDDLRDYRPKIYNFMMSSMFDEILNRYHIKKSTGIPCSLS